MGIDLGVITNYFITIFTIKGWYDIERYDCIKLTVKLYFIHLTRFWTFYAQNDKILLNIKKYDKIYAPKAT